MTSGSYSYSSTPYAGFEDEVMRLRNATRSVLRDRAYMDWRYRAEPGVPQARVFWSRDQFQRPVGMCSLIFHNYWVDGRPTALAVLGDISVEETHRRKGLGHRLLKDVCAWVDGMPGTAAIVLPNALAEAPLGHAGWRRVGTLVPYVYPLKPGVVLPGRMANAITNALAGSVFRTLAGGSLRMHVYPDSRIELLQSPDDDMEAMWACVPKVGLVARDRGIDALTWRYVDHPSEACTFAKAIAGGRNLGYVVYRMSTTERAVHLHDVLVSNADDARPVLAAFLLTCLGMDDMDSVRFLLADSHPYRRKLALLGFVRRTVSGIIQTYGTIGRPDANLRWFLTWGDKDI